MTQHSTLPKLTSANPEFPAFGISFKTPYFPELLSQTLSDAGDNQSASDNFEDIQWLEVHPENYMSEGGLSHQHLSRIREIYPVSMHGVGLSLGSAGQLSSTHLSALAQLNRRHSPWMMSEHISWSNQPTTQNTDQNTETNPRFLNDLLPLPMIHETAEVLISHIKQTQDTLGRQILVENPSLYIDFNQADFTEPELINYVLKESGAGLLLDINNVFVSSHNQQKDPYAYLDAIDITQVGEVHLAGHANITLSDGSNLLVDDHGSRVINDVLALYVYFADKYQKNISQSLPATLIEWDTNPPPISVLLTEINKVKTALTHRDIASLKQQTDATASEFNVEDAMIT